MERVDSRPRAELLYSPGQIVPGTSFRVTRFLGSGGMGSVYEVMETGVNKGYVMKVIRPELLSNPVAAARMQKEASTLASLHHPNIVQVFFGGLTADSPPLNYYVMERLCGYPLSHLLSWHRKKDLRLPMSWFFLISQSLLAALEYAHKKGIIHRDVKPENIFIHFEEENEPKPVVKLLDFGILASLADKARSAPLGFSGTYAYAAPEQLRGAPAARGMDLFAAGLVMYEMLAGRPAFDGTRSKEPQPLSTHCAVPPDVDQLVRRLVEANPAARLESAAQAGRELMNLKSQCIGDETLSSEPIALESDADIGQRWVTNVLGSIVEPKAASSASRGLGRSRFSKLRGFPSITRSVVTRTGWGQTISERLSRARLRGALLGASFAAAAAALAWWFVSLSPPSVVRTDPMSMVRSIPSGGGPDHALLADTNPPPQGATGPTSALASGTAASSGPAITAKDLAGAHPVDESERRPPTGRNSKPARRASESQRSDPLAFP